MFKNKQIALFSDLHIGVHKDSPEWHNIALNFGDWFVTDLSKRNITDIIFCGDFFHTRHEIEQTTLRCGIEFLSKFKNFNIVMIPGNHCCYFKNNATVHSLEVFKSWENVTVLDVPTLVKHSDRRYMFCPWETNTDDIQACDVIFGHFELVNFKMNSFKVCEHGQSAEDIHEKGSKIVTGHFHLRDHRQYDNGREVLYLGAPYQMDFGERDQVKGYTIFDSETLKFQFIENVTSPVHIKIRLSELLDQKDKISSLKDTVKNNIVCFIVDRALDQDKLHKITTMLTSMNPLQLRVEHTVCESFIDREQEHEIVGVDIQGAIHEFVDSMTVDVSKEEILSVVQDIYKRALIEK